LTASSILIITVENEYCW